MDGKKGNPSDGGDSLEKRFAFTFYTKPTFALQ